MLNIIIFDISNNYICNICVYKKLFKRYLTFKLFLKNSSLFITYAPIVGMLNISENTF